MIVIQNHPVKLPFRTLERVGDVLRAETIRETTYLVNLLSELLTSKSFIVKVSTWIDILWYPNSAKFFQSVEVSIEVGFDFIKEIIYRKEVWTLQHSQTAPSLLAFSLHIEVLSYSAKKQFPRLLSSFTS